MPDKSEGTTSTSRGESGSRAISRRGVWSPLSPTPVTTEKGVKVQRVGTRVKAGVGVRRRVGGRLRVRGLGLGNVTAPRRGGHLFYLRLRSPRRRVSRQKASSQGLELGCTARVRVGAKFRAGLGYVTSRRTPSSPTRVKGEGSVNSMIGLGLGIGL